MGASWSGALGTVGCHLLFDFSHLGGNILKVTFSYNYRAQWRRERPAALARPVVHVSASGLADAGKGSNYAGFLGRVALAGGERREF